MLSNVKDIDASTIALWYYWRWKIETFFKLMKSAGHQLEAWQQESALAIAKRLLVASMACVTVWAIAADESQEVAELRGFLVKLSGRQMRHQQVSPIRLCWPDSGCSSPCSNSCRVILHTNWSVFEKPLKISAPRMCRYLCPTGRGGTTPAVGEGRATHAIKIVDYH